MNRTRPHRQFGFTLIEVIIAVTLLAFISVFVAQSIQKGLQARAKIQKDIDRTVALRDAIALMSRDIQLAFNYRDINIQLYNAAVKERCKKPATAPPPTNPNTPPANPAPPPATPPTNPNQPNTGLPQGLTPEDCKEKEEKILTQFIGEADKLDFTSLSNVRIQKDVPTSDQAEIGYELKNCKTRLKGEDAGQCLWRRISPIIDDDVTKGGQESVLVENVKSLAFRYLSEGTDGEWQKVWSSSGQENASTSGKFPLAVEITLQIYDKQFKPPKELGMTAVAALRFPNNPKDTPAITGGDANATTQQQTPTQTQPTQ